MRIYEIDAAMEALVDQETGELLDVDAFMSLQMQRDEKIENMIRWHKNEAAEAEAIKAEAKALAERAANARKRADRLKQYIAHATDGTPFKCAAGETAWRKSMAVEIEEGTELPDEYTRIKREPDKTALKDAIKGGTAIAGVALVERMSMSIK